MPMPRSITSSSTSVPLRASRTFTGASSAEYLSAFVRRFATTRSSRDASAEDDVAATRRRSRRDPPRALVVQAVDDAGDELPQIARRRGCSATPLRLEGRRLRELLEHRGHSLDVPLGALGEHVTRESRSARMDRFSTETNIRMLLSGLRRSWEMSARYSSRCCSRRLSSVTSRNTTIASATLPLVVSHARARGHDAAPLAVRSRAEHLVVHELLASQRAHERTLLGARGGAPRDREPRSALSASTVRADPRRPTPRMARAASLSIRTRPLAVGDDDALAQVLEQRVELRALLRLGLGVLLLADAAQHEALVERAIELLLLDASRSRRASARSTHQRTASYFKRLDEVVLRPRPQALDHRLRSEGAVMTMTGRSWSSS